MIPGTLYRPESGEVHADGRLLGWLLPTEPGLYRYAAFVGGLTPHRFSDVAFDRASATRRLIVASEYAAAREVTL